MTSGRRNPLYFHNEGRQQPWLRELTPCPSFQIHPDTAAELGIEQGDWCWIESKRGKIRECADLFYGIRPGTIECDHQWWYPELSAPKHGWDLSNVNVLVNMDHESQDPICGTCNCRAYLVEGVQSHAGEQPVRQPVPVRRRRHRDHPYRNRSSFEGMAAHLRVRSRVATDKERS